MHPLSPKPNNNPSLHLCFCRCSPADLAPRLSGGQLGYARPRTQDSSFSLDGGAIEGEGQGPDAAGAARRVVVLLAPHACSTCASACLLVDLT